MNKKNSILNSNIGFDFADFFWRLLYQWKAIIIFCILMAIIFVMVGFKKELSNSTDREGKTDVGNSNTNLSLSDKQYFTDTYGNESIMILESLEEADQIAVVSLLQQKRLLERLKVYYDVSPYMDINPDHVRRLTINYSINCQGKANEKNIEMILKEYGKLYYNNDFLNEIKNAMNIETESSFIKDLITVETDVSVSSRNRKGVDSFYINIIIPTGVKNIEKIEEITDETIRKIRDDLSKKIGEYTVEKIEKKDYTFSDMGILNSQNDMVNRINNLSNNLKIATENLQGNQKTAYESVQKLSNKYRGNKQPDEIETTEVSNGSTISVSKYNLKYGIAGFFAGFMIYISIYLFWLLFRGRFLTSALLINNNYSRFLKQIHLPNKYHGIRMLFYSPFVENIRYGDRGSTEEETMEAAFCLSIVCKNKKISKLRLISCGTLSNSVLENNSKIRDNLNRRGISCFQSDISELYLDENLDIRVVSIIVEKDRTMVKELTRLYEQLQSLQIDIVGVIFYD